MDNEPNSGYQRLEDQIIWYDGKSISNQNWHKGLNVNAGVKVHHWPA